MPENQTGIFFTVWVTMVRVGFFLKIILKLRVYSEEKLILDILLVTAYLNR